MGLDQYLKAEYYFSDTWEDTAGQAAQVVSICGVPNDLAPMKQVSVFITLVHWRNEIWLEDYILRNAQADLETPRAYVDDQVLTNFVGDADKVIADPSRLAELFPNPPWVAQFRDRDIEGDLITIGYTRDKFVEILEKLPDADFYYESDC